MQPAWLRAAGANNCSKPDGRINKSEPHRRHHMAFLRTLATLFAAAALSIAGPAAAQSPGSYPSKPIRIVVPFPAGGPSDVLARLIGQKLNAKWGQPVVVDNRAGGNTIIAADLVAKAPADGYTLLLTTDNTLVMNQFLYTKLSYDPIRDFEPVAKIAIAPLLVLASADGGPKDVRSLLAQAKAQPGSVNFGYGTLTSQLVGELIKSTTGAQITPVAYKGSAGVVQGLLSKDVTFIVDALTAGLPHVQSGRFRALANLGKRPIPALPGLPTFTQEIGRPDFDIAVWLGVVAPHGTPAPIIAALNEEIARIMVMPDVKAKLDASGLMADVLRPAPFEEFIRTEAARWKPVIEQANIKLQ